MGIFNDCWEDEVYRLKVENVRLQNKLRISEETRQFLSKDAQAEHMRAERLRAENNRLRSQLAAYLNSDEKYRDDFIDEDEIITEVMKRG